MDCQELFPGKACLAGKCVVNNTAVCQCANGFSHSPEFVYFHEGPVEASLCSYNERVIEILYIIAVSFMASAFILQLAFLEPTKRATQARRLKTTFASLAFLIIATVYRLVGKSVGFDDVYFSFLVAQGFAFFLLSVYTFVLKGMHLLVSDSEWTSTNVQDFVYSYKRAGIAARGIEFAACQFLWIAAVARENQPLSLSLFYIFCASIFLVNLQVIYFFWRFRSTYEGDLEAVTDFKFGASSRQLDSDDRKLIRKWRKGNQKKMYLITFAIIHHILPCIFLAWIPLFFPFGLQVMLPYVVPISFSGWPIKVLLEIYVAQKRRNQKQTLRKLKTRNSFIKHVEPNRSITRVDDVGILSEEPEKDELV
mmetsp:Transcript_11121/g.12733  ORF Transcript_11121/g.12733 Transcript_11121/m.12733 type:complete len:366 (+) Transcript_11121:47-1144(+)